MNESSKWRTYWDQKSGQSVSDYEFDRGANPRPADVEALSTQEFIAFVDPKETDVLLDAGCGTGVNIVLLHDRVRRIIAVDFSEQAVARCQRRVESQSIQNAEICPASVTQLPLEDRSVDRIICMSVFHYLGDDQVRTALREFARVLRPFGTLILHVKNSASIYLSTLRVAKRVKKLLGADVTFEHVRPFSWYRRELDVAGFRLADYNAFNLVILEGMPQSVVHFMQRVELRHHKSMALRFGFVRRHGADLKLKAQLA